MQSDYLLSNHKRIDSLDSQFVYNARIIKSEAMVVLLARDTKNLTKIRFDYPPKPAFLKLLIENNNIKKVKFEHCNNEKCFLKISRQKKLNDLAGFLTKTTILLIQITFQT